MLRTRSSYFASCSPPTAVLSRWLDDYALLMQQSRRVARLLLLCKQVVPSSERAALFQHARRITRGGAAQLDLQRIMQKWLPLLLRLPQPQHPLPLHQALLQACRWRMRCALARLFQPLRPLRRHRARLLQTMRPRRRNI